MAAGASEAASVTLHIREETTALGPALLPFGWRSIARDYFRHTPPSPLDLENAIAAIEDAMLAARAELPRNKPVLTKDALIRDLAVAAGSPDTALTLDAVEQMFQRLAAEAADPRTAVLIILRELMHHLRLTAVSVQDG